MFNNDNLRVPISVVQEALAHHGKPEISIPIRVVHQHGFHAGASDTGIKINMEDRGLRQDNVFIERLWRSIKYECVYLHAFETGPNLHVGLSRYIRHYNFSRPHSSLTGRPPQMYIMNSRRYRFSGLTQTRQRVPAWRHNYHRQ